MTFKKTIPLTGRPFYTRHLTKAAAMALTYLSCLGSPAWGSGGGWVGNARFESAFNHFALTPLDSRDQSDIEIIYPAPKNYFMLNDGEMTFGLHGIWETRRVQRANVFNNITTTTEMDESRTAIGITFEYGLSDRWSWSNLVNFSYRLLPNTNNHELKLDFGLIQGDVEHSDVLGAYMTPGASLSHTWAISGFRVTQSLGAHSVISQHRDQKSRRFAFGKATHRLSLSQQLGTNWSLALAAGSTIGFNIHDRLGNAYRTRSYYVGGANPQISLARKLGDAAAISYAFSVNSVTNPTEPTSILSLQVKF